MIFGPRPQPPAAAPPRPQRGQDETSKAEEEEEKLAAAKEAEAAAAAAKVKAEQEAALVPRTATIYRPKISRIVPCSAPAPGTLRQRLPALRKHWACCCGCSTDAGEPEQEEMRRERCTSEMLEAAKNGNWILALRSLKVDGGADINGRDSKVCSVLRLSCAPPYFKLFIPPFLPLPSL